MDFLLKKLNSKCISPDDVKELIRCFGEIGDIYNLIEGFRIKDHIFWFEIMGSLENEKIGFKGKDFEEIFNQLNPIIQNVIITYLKQHRNSKDKDLSVQAESFLEELGLIPDIKQH